MPELPEIMSRAREMKRALVGKTITGIEVIQPKCLNMRPATLRKRLIGAVILDVTHHGKWIFARTSQGHLLLNLGMGGDLLLTTRKKLPEKYQFVFDFDDGKCMSVRFWWFGYVHYAPKGKLDKHEMTAKLGPDVLKVSREEFREIARGRRGAVKSFLLNQKNVAGIGNAFVQDILFLARLHPLTTLNTLNDDEIDRLWQAIRDGLLPAAKKGGSWYEKTLRGKPGGFVYEDLLVGYREGKPCPICGTEVVKLRTGSTQSFICPSCQKRKRAAAPHKRGSTRRSRPAAHKGVKAAHKGTAKKRI
ncbi:Fpg/Nei family DNA glycosylase [bacterium]|nr:Fpg/Nei family DNA glycosylase [bacterium]